MRPALALALAAVLALTGLVAGSAASPNAHANVVMVHGLLGFGPNGALTRETPHV